MTSLQIMANVPPIADILGAFDMAAGAVGGAMFGRTAASAFRSVIEVDRLYFFDVQGPRASRLLFWDLEMAREPMTGEHYNRQYLPVDPILGALDAADGPDRMVLLRVEPQDIVEPTYRRELETAGIVERVSLVRRTPGHWRCLNVARRASGGTFQPDELSRLAAFTRLFLPLAARHEALTTPDAASRLTVAQLEGRFATLGHRLSRREVAVCARAAFGMTVEGAALDLDIGRASVLTYRKRAYARLGITSANELCKLVMH